jgi:hypothetical protein
MNPFDALKYLMGAAAGGAAMLAWAVFLHGPAQYEAGGEATAAKLDAATKQAAKEIADEADRADFNRRNCILSGRVFDFASGGCLERNVE